MTERFRQLVMEWDGLAVVTRYDHPTGTWVFIALHDPTLGMAVGGCRMKVYPTPEDGLLDALRLARGMTHKWAAIDFDYGGGKAVLAMPRRLEGEERAGLLRRFGRLLNALNGAYGTGVDLGATPDDMAVVKEVSPWVLTGDEWHGGHVDPGPYTALGVHSCMRVALERLEGSDAMRGRTVVIQGVGGVGTPLARVLAEDGARLQITDIDHARGRALAQELGAGWLAENEVVETPCDILAPCAIGGTINRTTIPLLRCRAIAGSANNQLGEDADADRLHERGILYAPDYIVNAGGAMAFGLMQRGVSDDGEIRSRVVGIGDSLAAILAEAAQRDESPLHAAFRKVERVLAAKMAESV